MTHGVYDTQRCIVSLHDSERPDRWILIRPEPDDSSPTREQAFASLIAVLIAVLGARLEPQDLGRVSMGGPAKAALGILLILGVIAAILLVSMLL
jgi:hypothetical protein